MTKSEQRHFNKWYGTRNRDFPFPWLPDRKTEMERAFEAGLNYKKKETQGTTIAPNSVYKKQAEDILIFLNEKTGRKYRPVPANITIIVARLKEGYKEEEIRQVIANRRRKWAGNDKMEEYMRPKTLFNRTNMANYTGLLG